MKNIIQFNPDVNIESHSINKHDIVLVYNNINEPIGYVHQNERGLFILHANFISDNYIIEEKAPSTTLADLMNHYSGLQFKLVE